MRARAIRRVALALLVAFAVLAVLDARELTPEARAQNGSTRTVDLVDGFNLVGWAVDQDATQAIAATPTVSDLFQFDASRDGFDSFSTALPAALNSLATLGAGHGVWALSDGAASWDVPDVPAGESLSIDLDAGFNLVAWFGPDGTHIDEALAPIADVLLRAFGWVPPE